MFFFLRKLRKSLFTSSQVRKPASPVSAGQSLWRRLTGRYLLYAIGEILLVMIGILLALQVNNWNEQKKTAKRELNLLKELRANLETNVKNLSGDIFTQEAGAIYLKKVIQHLENKRPFDDSLSYFLMKGMPAPDVILTSSAFETLKSTGLELISSDSLRQDIINLFEVDYPYLMQETRRLEDQLWPAVVLPIQQKHFKFLSDGGYYPTNYSELLEDQEFVNMLSFRLRLRTYSTYLKKEAINSTEKVIASISKELNGR